MLILACGQLKTKTSSDNIPKGTWISINDSNYVTTIADSKITEYYNNEKTDSFLYVVDGGRLIKTNLNDSEKFIYDIVM